MKNNDKDLVFRACIYKCVQAVYHEEEEGLFARKGSLQKDQKDTSMKEILGPPRKNLGKREHLYAISQIHRT